MLAALCFFTPLSMCAPWRPLQAGTLPFIQNLTILPGPGNGSEPCSGFYVASPAGAAPPCPGVQPTHRRA